MGRERGGDDVPRRVSGRRSGELDRLAMRRIFDEREDVAAKTHLPGAKNHAGVLLVAPVGHERTRVAQAADVEDLVVGAAEDDVLAAIHHRSRLRLVGLRDERGDRFRS